MATQRVELQGNDISAYVQSIPNVALEAGSYGQVTINPITSLVGLNTRAFWTASNPASPFFNNPDLKSMDLRIYLNDVLTFQGGILSINTNGAARTASVSLRSVSQILNESGCIYSSIEPESPAMAASMILTRYGVPFDSGSFSAANQFYVNEGVLVRVQTLSPDQTILSVLQRLTEIGVARLSLVNNELRWDSFDVTNDDPPLYTFTDEQGNPDGITLLTPAPNDEALQKDALESYNVTWLGTPTAAYGNQERPGKAIDGGPDQAVRITDFDTAVWVGDRWLQLLQRPQRRITVHVPERIGRTVQLAMAVAVDYSKWNRAIIMDVVRINSSTKTTTQIVGLTR